MNDIDDLKKTYQNMKKLGETDRINFLDSIVSYCGYIGFDNDKTLTMLALIRNCLPNVGQSWNDIDSYDDIDIEYNKKLLARLNNV